MKQQRVSKVEEFKHKNSYSISHLLGTVTTRWQNSDGVVTIDICPQQGDYAIDQLCSHRA